MVNLKRDFFRVLAFIAGSVVALVVLVLVVAAIKIRDPVVFKDINYVEGGTNPHQTLDLYIPADIEEREKVPLIIWIHGGAWISGDKASPAVMWQIVGRRFAMASINYRYATESPHPAQVNDCKTAVRWLRDHAEQYHLDPSRFGCWGHSAGGHLATLLGTTGDLDIIVAGPGVAKEPSKRIAGSPSKGEHSVFPSSVQAVSNWAGPVDLTSLIKQQSADSKIDFSDPTQPLGVLLGGKAPGQCLDASPIFFLSADDPPLLLVHGDRDDVIPTAQSHQLYKRAKELGWPKVTLVIEHGESHPLNNVDALFRTMDFFEKTLKKR